MIINLKDIVTDTNTNASGYTLFIALENLLLKSNDVIYLSFEGSTITSTSFLNSSLGAIVEKYEPIILKRIKPIKLKMAQGQLLKNYFSKELELI